MSSIYGPVHWLDSCDPRGCESVADSSAHSKSNLQRPKQGRLAEWLEQALHCTPFQHPRTHSLVFHTGDEDDWNLLPAKRQFLLEIEPGHARHGDVEDQTSGLADAIGREELFRRRERLGCKAELPQQVGQRLAHGLVVVDDRDEGAVDHHGLPMTSAVTLCGARGITNEKVAPGPSFAAAHRRP